MGIIRKTIVFIALFILTITSVNAMDNKLYFTEKNNGLYYESTLIDKDVFMNHPDMLPGEEYTDELLIENHANDEYTLFFKLVPRKQSSAADDLLKNILMKITLDDKVIYEGKALGLDYKNQGINLQKAVKLGNFTPSKTSKMVVETKLSEEYNNVLNYSDYSYIDWSFYAQYGDDNQPVEIIPVPNTMKNNFRFIAAIAIIIVILGVVIMEYAIKGKKN